MLAKVVIGLLAVLAVGTAFHRHPFAPKESIASSDVNEEPLLLTPLLEQHGPHVVRDASKVVGIGNFTSYAGFYTANKTVDNNMFVWYFPAQNGDANAPLLIWLQGGPGGASTFGLFSEIGPFFVDEDMKLHEREFTWNKEFSLLFIDNPVGAGFSYTGSGKGYAKNSRVDVARDLYSVMQQFYETFPDQKSNDLYITGESYAGHYIPAFAAYIHNANENHNDGDTVIPLKGVSIGDGWIDPIYQMQAIPGLVFNTGLASESQRKQLQNYTDQTVNAIKAGNYEEAFKIWDLMLNGDLYPYPTYFYNLTGTLDYDNFLNTLAPKSFGYYSQFLNLTETRKAIHVGNAAINSGRDCEMNLINDVMDSYKPELTVIMDNYKVMLYNGNLDLIVGVPLTETFIPTIPWKGQSQFDSAPRKIWKVEASDDDVAGYVTTVNEFHQVVIRNAGHIVPYDQGRAAMDLITRFVKGTL